MDSAASTSPGRLTGPELGRNAENGSTAPDQLPLWRLNLMRVGYLVLAVGLAVVKWPGIVHHDQSLPLMEGVVNCMLGALCILAFVGLRYPVQMLPVLLFESLWKVIWLTTVALPLWSADQMDADTREVASACLWVVIILAVIPWPYVYRRYALQRGDRWH